MFFIYRCPYFILVLHLDLDSLNSGYRFRIYDAYRPTNAVKYFIRRNKKPGKKTHQNRYYLNFKKEELFPEYICLRSSHSRGSTVELTICIYSYGKCEDLKWELFLIFWRRISLLLWKYIY